MKTHVLALIAAGLGIVLAGTAFLRSPEDSIYAPQQGLVFPASPLPFVQQQSTHALLEEIPFGQPNAFERGIDLAG